MTIYKRGRVYWIRYQMAGREIRLSCHATTRAEAKAFAEKMAVVRKAGSREDALKLVDIMFPPETEAASGLALTDVYAAFVRLRTSCALGDVSETTARKTKECINRFLRWARKAAPAARLASDVTGAVAARYAEALANERNHKGVPLSPKTRKNLIGMLGGVWSLVEKEDPKITNPWKGLTPRGGGERREAYTPEQVEAILAAAERVGKNWPIACRIALDTGLRYGDVATLDWSAVDMEQGVIAVTPRKTAAHGVSVMIPMTARLKAALASYGQNCARNGFLLPNHAAHYCGHDGAGYRALNFREVLNAAGIEGSCYSFHSFRHTFRSRLAEAGVSLEIAKRLCGHTRDETSARYDHASHLDQYRAAIDAVAANG